jgi:hypothetical protein
MHQSNELTQFFVVRRYYVTKVTSFVFLFLIDRFSLQVIYNSRFTINNSHDNNCSARIFLDNPRTSQKAQCNVRRQDVIFALIPFHSLKWSTLFTMRYIFRKFLLLL